MRYRKRSNRSQCRLFIFLLSAVIIVLIAIIKTEKSIKPVAELQSEHIAQKTASQIIEKTVSDYLEANRFTYSDFAAVLYDNEKKVSAIETIPYNINKVQSELGALINKNLEKNCGKAAEIPVGSLMNSNILAGKGPKINIRISPVGSAQIKIENEFSSGGLNQTCHRISAVITVKMTSSVPLYSFDINTEFEFILAENVIVGRVPEISPYNIR